MSRYRRKSRATSSSKTSPMEATSRKAICSTPSIRATSRRRSIRQKLRLQRDSAALDYARANLSRGETLAQSGYLAKDTFDQRTSATRQAQAALAMDEAAVHAAELNLSYSQIRAPFAGRLGRNQASVGTLVTTGSSTLNTLVQLDPIYVTFNPSEADLEVDRTGARQGKDRRRGLPAWRSEAAPQRRTHVSRQQRRPFDWHHHRPRDHRQYRSIPAARPIRPHSRSGERAPGRADGAADGARL